MASNIFAGFANYRYRLVDSLRIRRTGGVTSNPRNTVSHQARLSRNADAGAGLVGDLGPQARGHPHVFALNDLDHAFMRPAKITQVARESGGRGARGRVLVNAADWERIARVEALRRLGVDQAERPDAISQRESSSGVQIVAERQDEVIGACMGDSRRYPRIERLYRKAEQSQGFCNQFVLGRVAASGGD